MRKKKLGLPSAMSKKVGLGTVCSIEAIAEKAIKMAQDTDDKKKATLMKTAEIHVWELINESNSDRIVTLKFKGQGFTR